MEVDFVECDIIKYLRDNKSIYYGDIQKMYVICENILSEIPKQFSNYTLHDIKHSVRVIEYMNDLVREHIKDFSELQLTLIIYAGLLHDVGMFVSDDEKKILFKGFENNIKFKKMLLDEKNIFLREYIRKNHGRRVGNVFNENVNNSTQIQSLFFIGSSSSYDLSELIFKICQSHTENCEWITENLPVSCAYANDKIYPQYIAFLLRIGDALDIDDRRAPYLLYKLLNPQGQSDIEWKKHIPITNYNKINKVGDYYEISFSGECREPEVYRNIMEYIDWINEDLKKIITISNTFPTPYQLNIRPTIKRCIIPHGFSSDLLKFKLDYNSIIKLLMGEKIYGNKRDGLRELLQNSIDAVKLMNNIYVDTAEYGTNAYFPEIRVIVKKSNNSFEIRDNGTGMSQEILERYFFNIGNSYYTSEEFSEYNYKYEPIGHFGIGFLACFMLSSNVKLETKYYKDRDALQLIFNKNSPYITKLEEQNQETSLQHGTRIILKYDEIIPYIFENNEDIIDYLKKLLIIDGYKLYFIDQDIKKTLEIESPKLEKHYQKNNEIIDFVYNIESEVSVKFDIFNFFNDNNDVFIVKYLNQYDEPECVSLSYYEENIRELEILIQTKEKRLDQIINEMDDLSEYYSMSNLVLNMLWAQREEKTRKITDDNIREYFENYVYQFIKNDMISWYDIPIILNKSIFDDFVKCVENEGEDVAIRKYSNELQYISVLTDEDMTDKLLLYIANTYLELYSDDILEVSYYNKYPVCPQKKEIMLYSVSPMSGYSQLKLCTERMDIHYYLKGVCIEDRSTIPYYGIEGIEMKDIYINIKKGKYDTDVARSNFDSNSKNKILNRVLCMIYEDIIKSNILDVSEVELVSGFLNKYYNEYDL